MSRNPKLGKRFGVSESTGLPEIVFLKTTDYKEWHEGDVIKKARVDETRYGRSSTSVDQLRQFLKGTVKLRFKIVNFDLRHEKWLTDYFHSNQRITF